jgi:hypothetical protein
MSTGGDKLSSSPSGDFTVIVLRLEEELVYCLVSCGFIITRKL